MFLYGGPVGPVNDENNLDTSYFFTTFCNENVKFLKFCAQKILIIQHKVAYAESFYTQSTHPKLQLEWPIKHFYRNTCKYRSSLECIHRLVWLQLWQWFVFYHKEVEFVDYLLLVWTLLGVSLLPGKFFFNWHLIIELNFGRPLDKIATNTTSSNKRSTDLMITNFFLFVYHVICIGQWQAFFLFFFAASRSCIAVPVVFQSDTHLTTVPTMEIGNDIPILWNDRI